MNSILIQVKYLGPTNYRGSRIKLTTFDVRHRNNDKPKSITLSYNYTHNSSTDQAKAFLTEQGLKLIASNSNSPINYLMAEWDWDALCKIFKIKQESEV